MDKIKHIPEINFALYTLKIKTMMGLLLKVKAVFTKVNIDIPNSK